MNQIYKDNKTLQRDQTLSEFLKSSVSLQVSMFVLLEARSPWAAITNPVKTEQKEAGHLL